MSRPRQDIAFIILAAGLGTRLAGAISDRPKWMIPVDSDTTIGSHQLDALDTVLSLNSPRLVITGAHAEVVERYRADRVAAGRTDFTTCKNDRFAEWNNWYSLLIGLECLDKVGWDGPTLVINGDLYCPPAWIADFVTSVDTWTEATLVVDSSRPLTDEAMKVEVHDGLVVKIGKTGLSQPTGEYIGLAGLTAEGRRELLKASQSLGKQRTDDWYEGAVQIAIDNGLKASVWTSPAESWVEVDNDEDLATARAIASQ